MFIGKGDRLTMGYVVPDPPITNEMTKRYHCPCCGSKRDTVIPSFWSTVPKSECRDCGFKGYRHLFYIPGDFGTLNIKDEYG